MADFYKVLKADPLGDPYTPSAPGAKPIQSYWCQVEGQEKAVMIGKQEREDGQPALTPGQHVYGDLTYAKSQKGNEYWKFKSAKVPDGVQWPQDSSPAPVSDIGGQMPGWFVPVANQINEIHKMLQEGKQVTDWDVSKVINDEPFEDKPVDMSEIDDLFGK